MKPTSDKLMHTYFMTEFHMQEITGINLCFQYPEWIIQIAVCIIDNFLFLCKAQIIQHLILNLFDKDITILMWVSVLGAIVLHIMKLNSIWNFKISCWYLRRLVCGNHELCMSLSQQCHIAVYAFCYHTLHLSRTSLCRTFARPVYDKLAHNWLQS